MSTAFASCWRFALLGAVAHSWFLWGNAGDRPYMGIVFGFFAISLSVGVFLMVLNDLVERRMLRAQVRSMQIDLERARKRTLKVMRNTPPGGTPAVSGAWRQGGTPESLGWNPARKPVKGGRTQRRPRSGDASGPPRAVPAVSLRPRKLDIFSMPRFAVPGAKLWPG